MSEETTQDQEVADEWAAALEEQTEDEGALEEASTEEDPWAAALEEQADAEQQVDTAPITQLDDDAAPRAHKDLDLDMSGNNTDTPDLCYETEVEKHNWEKRVDDLRHLIVFLTEQI